MFSTKVLMVVSCLAALSAALPPIYRSPYLEEYHNFQQHFQNYPHYLEEEYGCYINSRSTVDIFNNPTETFFRGQYHDNNRYYQGFSYNSPQYYQNTGY